MLFENLDERTQKFLVGGIFFCVFLLLLAFFKSHSPPEPADGGPLAATPTPQPTVDVCERAVMGSCQIELQEDVPECSNEERAVAEVADRLANPLESEECKAVQLSLGERCPKGCIMDYGTIVLVPGKVRSDVFRSEGQTGCRVRAQRSLTMQGRCVAEENATSSSPTPAAPR